MCKVVSLAHHSNVTTRYFNSTPSHSLDPTSSRSKSCNINWQQTYKKLSFHVGWMRGPHSKEKIVCGGLAIWFPNTYGGGDKQNRIPYKLVVGSCRSN